jgi:hypothetical protein
MAQRRTPPDDSATTVTAGDGPAPAAVPVAVRARPGAVIGERLTALRDGLT